MNTTSDVKTVEYLRICDPGHSWLRVPVAHLIDAGVVDKITDYSPRKRRMMYLEEDLDMWTFVDAMEAKGVQVEMNSLHVDDFDEYLHQSA